MAELVKYGHLFLVAALALLLTSPFAHAAIVPCPDDEARRIVCDLQSIVNPEGVQENVKFEIGGIPQWVYVRGQDRRNPVLLMVHGGPASPMMPSAWQFQRPIEEFFTIVNWDQRAAGRTLLESDPKQIVDTLTKDRYVEDVIEVAKVLGTRYGKRKIFVLGHSWGSIIALEAVQRHPELFYAYVGAGQVINGRENERISYEYGLRRAEIDGNTAAINEMKSIAPYPGDKELSRDRVIIARKWPQHYGGLSAYRNNSFYYFNAGILSPEYTDSDLETLAKGSQLTVDHVINEVLDAQLNRIQHLDVPVIMLLGRHDFTTPTKPVIDWLTALDAPSKKAIWFEHSAHLMLWEEPGKLLLTLVNDVRHYAKSDSNF